jgi:hypothetical protein
MPKIHIFIGANARNWCIDNIAWWRLRRPISVGFVFATSPYSADGAASPSAALLRLQVDGLGHGRASSSFFFVEGIELLHGHRCGNHGT